MTHARTGGQRPSRKSRISELLRARQQIDAELAELRSSELPAFELDNRQLLERLWKLRLSASRWYMVQNID